MNSLLPREKFCTFVPDVKHIRKEKNSLLAREMFCTFVPADVRAFEGKEFSTRKRIKSALLLCQM